MATDAIVNYDMPISMYILLTSKGRVYSRLMGPGLDSNQVTKGCFMPHYVSEYSTEKKVQKVLLAIPYPIVYCHKVRGTNHTELARGVAEVLTG